VDVSVPAHAVCAACRGAIWGRDGRYRIGEREYHADCFDISLFGPSSGVRSDKAIGWCRSPSAASVHSAVASMPSCRRRISSSESTTRYARTARARLRRPRKS